MHILGVGFMVISSNRHTQSRFLLKWLDRHLKIIKYNFKILIAILSKKKCGNTFSGSKRLVLVIFSNNKDGGQVVVWHMTLVPALGRQWQADL